MRVRFEEEEYFVMAVFEKDTRTGTMEEIRRVLPFIREDGEMLALVNSTLKKMEQLTDQEFSGMDLETYAQEPAEEA
ncbi:MAG TPA: transposon-transfer assisting family protein [Candidatus Choladousia intestinigallinarum]|nr:transposon-transfer assisting family protein [Candidatus Choladousia intestinigallinarum]